MSKRLSKAVSVLLACVMLASVILTGCDKEAEEGDLSWVLSTENYTVTMGQFTYFYTSASLNYLSYPDYYGIVEGVPLEEQECSVKNIEGYTWHDYILEMARTEVEEMLIMCEEAAVRGISLGEEELVYVDNNISALNSAAEKQGVSVDSLASENYGEGVTADDIQACLEMQALAAKAEQVIHDEPTYDDEALERECAENPGLYYCVDYRYFQFIAEVTPESKTSEVAEAKAKAKADADELYAASDDEESFLAAVEAYLREDIGMSDEKIEDELDNTLVDSYPYSDEGEFAKWAFEKDADGNIVRKAGDVKPFYDEANGVYGVYMIINPMYRGDYFTRNVRHILISTNGYDYESGMPDEEAKAKAEELLSELEEGGVTEEEFADMAIAHSMDPGSASDGGFYGNVAKGDMLKEFDNWLYDEARVAGDTGIVKTDYGYHIVYYAGESSSIKWKAEAEYNLREVAYKSVYNKAVAEHTITLNEYALENVKSACPDLN